MSLKRNISFIFSSRVLILASSTAVSIIVARFLGPSGKGVLALLAFITGISLQFGNLGIHSAATYYSARQPEKLSRITGNSLFLGLLTGLLITLVMSLIYWLKPGWFPGVWPFIFAAAVVAIPFQYWNSFAQSIMYGLGRIPLSTVLEASSGLATLVGLLIFMGFFKFGALMVICWGSLLAFGLAAAYFYNLGRIIKWHFILDFVQMKDLLGYGLRPYLACFLAYLAVRSDIYLVNLLVGTAQAGIYSIASGMIELLNMLSFSVSSAAFPYLSGKVSGKAETTAAIIRHSNLLTVLAVLLLGIFAYPLIYLLYGKAFIGAFLPTLLLLPGMWALSNWRLLNYHYASENSFRLNIISVLICAVIDIGLNLLLLPRIGIKGAAISLTIGSLTGFSYVLSNFLRQNRIAVRNLFVLEKGEWQVLLNWRQWLGRLRQTPPELPE